MVVVNRVDKEADSDNQQGDQEGQGDIWQGGFQDGQGSQKDAGGGQGDGLEAGDEHGGTALVVAT